MAMYEHEWREYNREWEHFFANEAAETRMLYERKERYAERYHKADRKRIIKRDRRLATKQHNIESALAARSLLDL